MKEGSIVEFGTATFFCRTGYGRNFYFDANLDPALKLGPVNNLQFFQCSTAPRLLHAFYGLFMKKCTYVKNDKIDHFKVKILTKYTDLFCQKGQMIRPCRIRIHNKERRGYGC
jgi:hypothetical protein